LITSYAVVNLGASLGAGLGVSLGAGHRSQPRRLIQGVLLVPRPVPRLTGMAASGGKPGDRHDDLSHPIRKTSHHLRASIEDTAGEKDNRGADSL